MITAASETDNQHLIIILVYWMSREKCLPTLLLWSWKVFEIWPGHWTLIRNFERTSKIFPTASKNPQGNLQNMPNKNCEYYENYSNRFRIFIIHLNLPIFVKSRSFRLALPERFILSCSTHLGWRMFLLYLLYICQICWNCGWKDYTRTANFTKN